MYIPPFKKIPRIVVCHTFFNRQWYNLIGFKCHFKRLLELLSHRLNTVAQFLGFSGITTDALLHTMTVLSSA